MTYNVNPGWINHGFLIRGTPQTVIIWYSNGTPSINRPRGLLIQGDMNRLIVIWMSLFHPTSRPKKRPVSLVGGFNLSEKDSSIGMMTFPIANIWKNKTCSSHHQPVYVYIYIYITIVMLLLVRCLIYIYMHISIHSVWVFITDPQFSCAERRIKRRWYKASLEARALMPWSHAVETGDAMAKWRNNMVHHGIIFDIKVIECDKT